MEPASFYPRNLLLNFNVVAVLGLGSLVALLMFPGDRARRVHGCGVLAGMYLTFAILQPMAHKEVCDEGEASTVWGWLPYEDGKRVTTI